MTEEWRPVVGFEGLYEVSDQGRVRSLDRHTIRSDGRPRRITGRIRAIHRDAKGYWEISLHAGGKSARRRVHVLIAAAFSGPRPEGAEVRHLDDDKDNNTARNIRYGTPAQNLEEKIANARTVRGEDCHFHKVTAADVLGIRALAGRVPQREIGERYGLTQSGVSSIVRRQAWRYV